MLKIVGASLIIIVCSFIGFYYANMYRIRPQQLRELIVLFNLLETEIYYALTPLPIAFKKIGTHLTNSVSDFAELVRSELTNDKAYTAMEAWRIALRKWQKDSFLIEEDLNILNEFAVGFGSSDKNEQIKKIKLIQELLKQQKDKAEAIREKYEKMYRTMGVLAGIAIVLIIL